MPAVSADITQKNHHCLRGLHGKYGKWDEKLLDILEGKLRIVQRKTRTETDSGDDDDDDDDEEEEEISEEPRSVNDTSERDGRYEPIRTDPKKYSLQLHTDGEVPQGENSKLNIRRSNRIIKKPNRYVSVPYQGNFYM